MYDSYFSEKQKLNIPNDLYKLDFIASILKENIDSMDVESDSKRYFIWDFELIICGEDYLNLRYSNPKGLVNRYEYSSGYKIPDIDRFEEERMQFYDFCEQNEGNLEIKIRYLNYLYDKSKRKFDYAKKLCECLKNFCNITDDDIELLYRISRLIDIAIVFNFNEYIEYARSILLKKVKEFDKTKKYTCSFGYYNLLHKVCIIKKKVLVDSTMLCEIISFINKSIEYFTSCNDYISSEKCAWELYEWYKSTSADKDIIDALILQIGEIYEKQAVYQNGKQELSSHLASSLFEKAIQHYSNFGIRNKVHDLKVLIKNSYKQGKTEIKEHNYNFDYYSKEIRSEIEQFNSGDVVKDIGNLIAFLNESINNTSNKLFPDFEKSNTKASKRIEEQPFWSLVGICKIHEGRKIFESIDKDDQIKYFTYEDYDIHLKLMLSVFYDNVWNSFIRSGLNAEIMINKITSWDYMDFKDKEIIKGGVQRFFEKDYISAIHILTPRFENIIREFFLCGGFATTSIKTNTVQHEQTFNDFLLNEYVINSLPKRLLELIKFVMVDNLGWNLRNNIAHGISEIEIFNSTTANMLIILYMIIVTYKWVNIDGELKCKSIYD